MMHVDVTLLDNMKVNATIRDFTIATDQPISNRGENSAPTPFELFLASLATCAGIYVKDFCMNRQIPTEDIRLSLDAEPGERGLMKKMKIIIHVPANFPEQYKRSLINVAELCLVKKTIQNPPVFEIETQIR